MVFWRDNRTGVQQVWTSTIGRPQTGIESLDRSWVTPAVLRILRREYGGLGGAHDAALVGVFCVTQCSGRDTTGRSGHHGTRVDHRALSGVTCGLYAEIGEFGKSVDPFFKTSNDLGAKDLRLWIS
jgi:hypothetical protein